MCPVCGTDPNAFCLAAIKTLSSLFTQTVGFFWDLENLQVPRGKSGCKLIYRLREKFLTEDKAESEFIIVCDATREKIEVLDDLNEAQESSPKVLEITSLPKRITLAMIKRELAVIVENLGGKCGKFRAHKNRNKIFLH
ncbi:unnamed protein product [Larinioides sclopetarius]|uniref:Uncharacterized protein n=1 Tax=Larinioides sclopetarius TaxID=280406 RepID=A0AAV2AHY6_9ARAC